MIKIEQVEEYGIISTKGD